MTEQQIREQFANDLKARLRAKAVFTDNIRFYLAEIEYLIDNTLNQVIPTEEEIKKMEE